MNQEWGRNQYAGEWPNPKAAWTIATVLLAVVSVTAICAYRYAYDQETGEDQKGT
jgi:hypothetical protein